MRVSVIIPFNKGDAFLRDCLNSLSEQEYKDYEILIVSDHYAGNINELVSPYMDKLPIRLFEVPEGKTGVAAARNIGLDNAQGEFVYFLDSDDYIFQDAIRTLVETADDTDEDMVYGKKHFTYYRRDVFLPIYIEKREALIAQKYIENGGAPGDFMENTTDSSTDSLSENDEDNDEDDDEDSDNADAPETGEATDEVEDDISEDGVNANNLIRSLIENSKGREYRNKPAYKEYMYNRFPEMQRMKRTPG